MIIKKPFTTYFFYIYIFCILTDRQTAQLFTENMPIEKMNLYKKKSDFYLKQQPKNLRLYFFLYIYAFCSLTDRPTDKTFIKQMVIDQRIRHKKIAADKQTFLFLNIYAFYSLTDRPNDKIFVEYMLLHERNVQGKNQISILISG